MGDFHVLSTSIWAISVDSGKFVVRIEQDLELGLLVCPKHPVDKGKDAWIPFWIECVQTKETYNKPERTREPEALSSKKYCFQSLIHIFNNFYFFIFPGKLMTPTYAKLPINNQPKNKLGTPTFQ